MRARPVGQEEPPEEGTAPDSSILPGESHGQRSLVGYSPWNHKELDMTSTFTSKQRPCVSSVSHSRKLVSLRREL